MHELYINRKLSHKYPNLCQLSSEWFTNHLQSGQHDKRQIEKTFGYLDRLIEFGKVSNIAIIGCGPKPQTIKFLLEKNINVVGVEPVESFVEAASEYLEDRNIVLDGVAESLPLANQSQEVVLLESVLEHVDSPLKTLDEIFRVLTPGGILYITTTNRYKFSIIGDNGEYNVPFFNLFPSIVKECFVFHHLHYDPTLANYTERPAVHWFSFEDLCKLGRRVGFAQFYSILDLVQKDDPSIYKNKVRTFLLDKIKYNPWLRAIALRQLGGTIIMLKRRL